MPRTPRSTQRASSPPVSHPRWRLSSHGLWPCWRGRGRGASCSMAPGSVLRRAVMRSGVGDSCRARSATFSGVYPNLASATPPGADAPKRSMLTLSSAQRSQPKLAAASTARVGTSGGRTEAWYSSGWASNRSHEGIETTRAVTPGVAQLGGGADAHADLAARADQHDVGLAVVDEDVGAPVDRRAGGALEHRQVLPGEDQRRGAVAGRGRPSRPGPPRWRRPGGSAAGPGMARSAARCSIGWWVGPSSPRPDRVVGPACRRPWPPTARRGAPRAACSR